MEVTETQIAAQDAAVTNLTGQLTALTQATQPAEQVLAQQIADQTTLVASHQAAGQPWRRLAQGVARLRTTLTEVQVRAQRQLARLQEALAQSQVRRTALEQEVAARQAARDALDTASQCRERHLEKDQIMLDLQVLLASLHDWVRAHYLPPAWQHLELHTATELLYRKAGCVIWGTEQIEIVFEPYRYADLQQAMAETCHRCNATPLRWRDGRLLRFRVKTESELQLCDC